MTAGEDGGETCTSIEKDDDMRPGDIAGVSECDCASSRA